MEPGKIFYECHSYEAVGKQEVKELLENNAICN